MAMTRNKLLTVLTIVMAAALFVPVANALTQDNEDPPPAETSTASHKTTATYVRDLGEPTDVADIAVAFDNVDDVSHLMQISTSLDGATYTQAATGVVSETLNTIPVNTTIRYIRVDTVGLGDLPGGVSFIDFTDPLPTPEPTPQPRVLIADTEALTYDGVADYVDLQELDANPNVITIEATVHSTDLANCQSRDCRIIAKATGVATADHIFMLSTIGQGDNTRLRFRLSLDGNVQTLIADDGDLIDNTWYHVAAVYDGDEMRLYLDGALVGSRAATGLIDQAPDVPVWIGATPPEPTLRPWAGSIDEVRIWDTVRSVEQLDEWRLYELPPAQYCDLVNASGDGCLQEDEGGA